MPPQSGTRALARTARAAGPALILAACAANPRGTAELPRQLARVGPPPAGGLAVPGAPPCAQRLRDPATGREYQLRGAPSAAHGMPGSPDPLADALRAVGLYVPVGASGGLRAVPLRVECGSLRVVGRA